jgi:hypothetical protein
MIKCPFTAQPVSVNVQFYLERRGQVIYLPANNINCSKEEIEKI